MKPWLEKTPSYHISNCKALKRTTSSMSAWVNNYEEKNWDLPVCKRKAPIHFPHHHVPSNDGHHTDSSNQISGKLSSVRILCLVFLLEAPLSQNQVGLSWPRIISALVHCTALALPLPSSPENSFPSLNSHGGLPAISPSDSPISGLGVLRFLCLMASILTFCPCPAIGNRTQDQASVVWVSLLPWHTVFPRSLRLSLCHFVSSFFPSQHCYVRITVFSQIFPLSENITYFGHRKLLIRSLKSGNFNYFLLLAIS